MHRTQEHIMQDWKKGDPCLVSVICATFNHELYIREAIESFLMQQTDFPFEIIIHDDASVDNTPIIIKKFSLLYPDIIKTIFQKENRYSKGGFKPSVYAAGHSKGKYITLCEGDDYWIDKQKLQKQFDAMQKHPEVDFSFHSAYHLRNGTRAKKISWDYNHDQVLPVDTILKSVTFAPTASYMLRREIFDKLPDWFFKTAPVADFFLEMYGAQRGGALYINSPMSIYRICEQNSWSSVMKANHTKHISNCELMLESLELLKDDFSNHLVYFRIKEAFVYFYMSKANLLSRNIVLFRSNIETSVAKHAFLSIKQRICYTLRRMPNLLWLSLKVQIYFNKLYHSLHF